MCACVCAGGQVPEDGTISGDRAQLIDAATCLIHLTCLASPRNAIELMQEHGVEKLLHLLSLLVGLGGVNGKVCTVCIGMCVCVCVS